MKKFKSLVYVLALALIFVGAASVTKAAAETQTYAVTWEQPEGCASVKVTSSEADLNSGDELAEGAQVFVTCTAAEGYTVEVTSDDVTVSKSVGDTYGFEMPAKAVTLKITATEEEEQKEPTTNEGAGTLKPTPNYAFETVDVTSDKQVYYQVVKSKEPGKLKPANWIKAAKNTDGLYCIDFSSLANSKNAYIALTTNNAAEEAEEVAVIVSKIKSVKVTLNYKTEKITNGLASVITTLNVKGVDKADDKADGTPADYSLQWKRGANGDWDEAADFTQLQWDMLKASNGTLYVAIDGIVKTSETFRLSKEAKVKIPKSAKAPTVKVDYVKGTLGLKNGMQVRVGDDTDWMDIIAYNKESKGTDVFALAIADATTSKKVSSVTVAEFVEAVKTDVLLDQDDDVKDGAEVTLTVRTAATVKKFPSMEGTVKLVLPKAAPTVLTTAEKPLAVSYTKADTKADPKVEAAYELDFSKLFTLPEGEKYSQYEYVLVGNKADGLNLAKQKWTKLPENGKVNLAKSIGKDCKYFKAADEKTATGSVKYEAIKAVYIRLAAVKATKTEAGVFASAYGTATVTVTENVPAAKEFTLTSDSKNAATATFKVDGKAVTKAAKDATVVIEYTPTSGKVIETVTYTVEGKNTPVTVNAEQGKYSFKMPEGNVTVTVTEKAQEPQAPTTYTLTVDADENGNAVVTVGEEQVEAAVAEATVKVAYTVSDPETKVVQSVVISYTLEGEETTKTLELEDGAYSFAMPAANVTITITETEKAAG